MDKITLLLIDDHKLLSNAWALLFNSDQRFQVIGETSNAEEAYRIVSEKHPSVVLTDINMAPVDGYTVTKMIMQLWAATKVIGVSIFNMPGYAKRMLQAGASGYVTKNSSVEELKKAILEVSNGKRYICDEVKNLLVMENFNDEDRNLIKDITRKELEVMELVRIGKSSKEIAVEMDISIKTVEVHRYNILRKLKLRNSAALVSYMHSVGM